MSYNSLIKPGQPRSLSIRVIDSASLLLHQFGGLLSHLTLALPVFMAGWRVVRLKMLH